MKSIDSLREMKDKLQTVLKAIASREPSFDAGIDLSLGFRYHHEKAMWLWVKTNGTILG